MDHGSGSAGATRGEQVLEKRATGYGYEAHETQGNKTNGFIGRVTRRALEGECEGVARAGWSLRKPARAPDPQPHGYASEDSGLPVPPVAARDSDWNLH